MWATNTRRRSTSTSSLNYSGWGKTTKGSFWRLGARSSTSKRWRKNTWISSVPCSWGNKAWGLSTKWPFSLKMQSRISGISATIWFLPNGKGTCMSQSLKETLPLSCLADLHSPARTCSKSQSERSINPQPDWSRPKAKRTSTSTHTGARQTSAHHVTTSITRNPSEE